MVGKFVSPKPVGLGRGMKLDQMRRGLRMKTWLRRKMEFGMITYRW